MEYMESEVTVVTYPSSPFLQPVNEVLADKLPQTVHYDVDHSGMALSDAIHGEGASYCIYRDHLAPSYTCSKKKKKQQPRHYLVKLIDVLGFNMCLFHILGGDTKDMANRWTLS